MIVRICHLCSGALPRSNRTRAVRCLKGVLPFCLVLVAVLGLLAQGARAEDRSAGEASSLGLRPWDPDAFDYYVRFDALSDLVERGISRSRHQATGRGIATAEIGNFYVSGAVYRLNNFPAGPKGQVQGEIEAGYEKRWGSWLADLSASYELADVNEHSHGTIEYNLRTRYDVTRMLSLTGFVGYSPFDDGHQILFSGGGLRLRITDELALHGQLGWSHYFDRAIDGYAFWRAGLDYSITSNISLGVTYNDSNLSKSDCALVAESRSPSSCGASVVGRLSIKFYRDDFEAVVRPDTNTAASAEPPPLDVLAKKLPRQRTSDDDD